MPSTTRTSQGTVAVTTEDVLCVPRTTIFPDGAWRGLITTGFERVLRTIRAASTYRVRADVETDPTQQQIIPYCVVHHPADGTYLLTRRLRDSSESRLHDLHSLGVGGHINPVDGRGGDPIVGGLLREWSEEVVCDSPATARLIAVINDDSDPVSSVHLALVFLVEPLWSQVAVREADKLAGRLLTLEQMRGEDLRLESWSQFVFDDLGAGAHDRARRSPLVVEIPPAA